jgi:hypothetical protein
VKNIGSETKFESSYLIAQQYNVFCKLLYVNGNIPHQPSLKTVIIEMFGFWYEGGSALRIPCALKHRYGDRTTHSLSLSGVETREDEETIIYDRTGIKLPKDGLNKGPL